MGREAERDDERGRERLEERQIEMGREAQRDGKRWDERQKTR